MKASKASLQPWPKKSGKQPKAALGTCSYPAEIRVTVEGRRGSSADFAETSRVFRFAGGRADLRSHLRSSWTGLQAALLQGPEFRCVQVAKSSHEAADLEKRLKEESDKASFAAWLRYDAVCYAHARLCRQSSSSKKMLTCSSSFTRRLLR